jgi:hypothetical protein
VSNIGALASDHIPPVLPSNRGHQMGYVKGVSSHSPRDRLVSSANLLAAS